MGRCSCSDPGGCSCDFGQGDGIKVSGLGSTRRPIDLALDIAKGTNNCIALTGAGTRGEPLTAAPIISSAAGNRLTCTRQGLYVGGEEEESGGDEPDPVELRYVDLWVDTPQKIPGGAEYRYVRFPYDDAHDDDPYGWHEPDNHPDGHRVDPKKWADDPYSAMAYPDVAGWCQIWANIQLAAGDYSEVRVQFVKDPRGQKDTTGTNHVAATPGGQFFTVSWATRVEANVPLGVRVAHNGKKAATLAQAQFKFTVTPLKGTP